jgi:hypothetical protein
MSAKQWFDPRIDEAVSLSDESCYKTLSVTLHRLIFFIALSVFLSVHLFALFSQFCELSILYILYCSSRNNLGRSF